MGPVASRASWTAALLLALATRAHGQEQPPARLPLELQWRAPAECPTADAVRAELERIAKVAQGYALTPLTASGWVERKAGSYAVELKTEHDGQRGERALSAPDCKTLVRTVTLVIALAFGEGVEVAADDGGTATGSPAGSGPGSGSAPGVGSGSGPGFGPESDSESDTESEPDTEPEPEPDSEPDSDTDAASDSAIPLTVILTLGGGAQLGLFPSAAFALAAGVELESAPVAFGLRVTGLPGVTETPVAGVEAQFRGLGGHLYACNLQPLAVLSLVACASFRAAALRAQSDGALEAGGATAPYYGVGAFAGLTFPREGALRVRLEGGFAVSLDRARFAIDNLGEVHHVSAFVGDLNALIVIAP